jgi:hypothetical protein
MNLIGEHLKPGGHLLLQTRTCVLDGDLDATFCGWHPLFRPEPVVSRLRDAPSAVESPPGFEMLSNFQTSSTRFFQSQFCLFSLSKVEAVENQDN